MNIKKIRLNYGIISFGLVFVIMSLAKPSGLLSNQEKIQQQIKATADVLYARYKDCSLHGESCLERVTKGVLDGLAQAMVNQGISASDALMQVLITIHDHKKQHGYKNTFHEYWKGNLQNTRCDFAALRDLMCPEMAQYSLFNSVMFGDLPLVEGVASLQKPTQDTIEKSDDIVKKICDKYQGTEMCESAKAALEELKKFQ